jgi:hypothetical protein
MPNKPMYLHQVIKQNKYNNNNSGTNSICNNNNISKKVF